MTRRRLDDGLYNSRVEAQRDHEHDLREHARLRRVVFDEDGCAWWPEVEVGGDWFDAHYYDLTPEEYE